MGCGEERFGPPAAAGQAHALYDLRAAVDYDLQTSRGVGARTRSAWDDAPLLDGAGSSLRFDEADKLVDCGVGALAEFVPGDRICR